MQVNSLKAGSTALIGKVVNDLRPFRSRSSCSKITSGSDRFNS